MKYTHCLGEIVVERRVSTGHTTIRAGVLKNSRRMDSKCNFLWSVEWFAEFLNSRWWGLPPYVWEYSTTWLSVATCPPSAETMATLISIQKGSIPATPEPEVKAEVLDKVSIYSKERVAQLLTFTETNAEDLIRSLKEAPESVVLRKTLFEKAFAKGLFEVVYFADRKV